MKKKVKKKGIIPRQGAKSKPAKVGGKRPVSAKPNWSKVGRRRLEDNDAIQQLASTLKAIREEKKISVTQVAKDLEIAPATLIKFEDRGYPVSVKVVLALAAKLGCNLSVTKKKVTKKKK